MFIPKKVIFFYYCKGGDEIALVKVNNEWGERVWFHYWIKNSVISINLNIVVFEMDISGVWEDRWG